ncbi:MAG TPA: arginine--tRNA ligase, partial [Afifellaceae bacterium]|nr:arginine--tRNA ligase [Afifellaceae bacterium]
MDLFAIFESKIRSVIESSNIVDTSVIDPAIIERINAEPPRDPEHGDVATNAAMILAKPTGAKPRDIATRLALALEHDDDISAVEVAGPGFVNIRLSDAFWSGFLKSVLEAGDGYGRSEFGAGKPVNVEYVSANPTGPMHVGHCRGAVVGDAIANLLDWTGYKVTREYYINDAGGQVDGLARSVHTRYRQALGKAISPDELEYRGDYLVPVGEALAAEIGDRWLDAPEDEWLPEIRELAIAAMMDMIRADLDRLGVHHDVYFSEKSLKSGGTDRVAEAINALRARDLVYQGTLLPPKGQLPEDWEDREQTLFRSTEFGDDVDRPLMKSDGSYTYFASDIAYHYDKYLRGFNEQIDVLGADHGGYVKRMKAAVTAMSGGEAALEIQLVQLVKLLRGGEPVTMGKRSGNLITLAEVVDEVGRDAVRYMMMFRKADAPLDFDFEAVTEKSKDNPVFYVQYGHARVHSVGRQAKEALPEIDLVPEKLAEADLALLTDEGERGLVKTIADWPRTLATAARTREPHRVAFYLYELASAFHAHWNRGKDMPHLRFIIPNDLST